MKIGVIIAVKDEAKEILNDKRYGWNKTSTVYESKNFPLLLSICGIGKAYAVWGLSQIVDKVDLIISLGTSGGLGNEAIGAIYTISEFVEHDMDVTGLGVPLGVTPFCEMKHPVIKTAGEKLNHFVSKVLNNLGISSQEGRAISGDTFLCDSKITEQKRDLFSAQLADMETAAIAKICNTKASKEMIAIRYITDNANHEAAGNWQENVKKSSEIFNVILYALLQNIDNLSL